MLSCAELDYLSISGFFIQYEYIRVCMAWPAVVHVILFVCQHPALTFATFFAMQWIFRMMKTRAEDDDDAPLHVEYHQAQGPTMFMGSFSRSFSPFFIFYYMRFTIQFLCICGYPIMVNVIHSHEWKILSVICVHMKILCVLIITIIIMILFSKLSRIPIQKCDFSHLSIICIQTCIDMAYSIAKVHWGVYFSVLCQSIRKFAKPA